VRLDSSVQEAQRAQAMAGLEAAQAQLDLATAKPSATDLEAARAAVAAAEAAYSRALEGATAEERRMALAQLRQAEEAVKLYQAQYDRIAGSPVAAMLPESLQLQQATLAKEAAQAQYDKVLKGATADQIAGAYAQLAGARAQLARLEEGAKPAQIDALKANVKAAENTLYLAQLQVDKTTIKAPADGFIYSLDATEGAMAGPGKALAVIFSHEVKILIAIEESRAAEARLAQPAIIRVDAYPDRAFRGKVTAIAPAFDPATRTVKVTVRPTGEDAQLLKPGMFATVQLEP
jgi:multidrug resistance efflux pump